MESLLDPIELKSATLNQQLFGWDLWDCFSELAYLRMSGKAETLLDTMNIGWRVEESCRLTRCKALLLDLRRVDLSTSGIDVLSMKKNTPEKRIRVAVKCKGDISLFDGTEAGEVSDDWGDVTSSFFSICGVKTPKGNRLINPSERFQKIQQVATDVSLLKASCFQWPSVVSDRVNAEIRISGRYRLGSDGKPDGMWISWQVDHLCEFINPHSLLVDLSSLDYTWGDDIFVHPKSSIDGDVLVFVWHGQASAFRDILGECHFVTDKAAAYGRM